MGRSRIVAAVVVGLGLLSSGATRAEADVITVSYRWIASGFRCFSSCEEDAGAPVDPVIGAFVLTFDNSRNLMEQTQGLTLTDLNIRLGSVPAYGYGASSDTLVLGGLEQGAQTLGANSDDFLLGINHVSRNLPQTLIGCACFVYAQSGRTAVWQPLELVIVPEPIAAVPEPATLSLLGTGAALVALRRTRSLRKGMGRT